MGKIDERKLKMKRQQTKQQKIMALFCENWVAGILYKLKFEFKKILNAVGLE